MLIPQYGKLILKEIDKSLNTLDNNLIDELIKHITTANNIFFVASGRSKLMLSAFCMRLNHLGFSSYIAGNIPCPPVKKGDIVIAATGSGKTPSIIATLNNIRQYNVPIIIMTASEEVELFSKEDIIISIKSPSKLEHDNPSESHQLMRTLFEQTVFLLAESIILCLSKDISRQDIAARHTNLE